MTAIQAFLIGIVCGISSIDGYWLGEAKFREPVVTGALVGLILGNLKQGLIIGAQLELIWMGSAAIGPVAGLAVGPGGTIGTAIALSTGSGIEAAMMFGVPVSILMQFLQTLIDTGYSIPMHKVDKLIDEGGKEKQIVTIHWMCGVLLMVIYTLLTFFVLYFGNNAINSIVNGLPDWANTGLAAVAKVLPALGFALLLNLLLEKDLIPYFIIGFCLSAYLNMSLVGVTAVSIALAFIIYIERKNRPVAATVTAVQPETDDEEEGDEL
ncbi:MAG TPA: PTS sugar transporter subunit IIC [Erysipelotrichaceae bacterium]|nr:PTS sugar transporter subunit IIC [Erysipelotrichaceae bacterium]